MIIRAKTFTKWMAANFNKYQMKDMVNHGVSGGFYGLTYYTDTCKLYQRFKDEIWGWLYDDAESLGCVNSVSFISFFGGSSDVGGVEQFENLLVWYAAERVARELTE